MQPPRLVVVATGLLIACLTRLEAGTVALEDFNTTVFNSAGAPVSGTISASWGTYSAGVFTPLFGATQSTINSGYFDAPFDELFVGLTQSDNTLLAAGTPLFASIFNIPGGSGDSTWLSSAEQIVLSDPAWIAPTFTLTTPELLLSLGSATVAVPLAQFGNQTGIYNYNSGSPQITLAAPAPPPPPSGGGSFTARAPGGVLFLTGTNATNGVSLAPGASTWASLSDRDTKNVPAPLDHRETLRRVESLPVTSWEYKHDPGRRYVGPMAQDFRAAFGLGADDKHLSTLDLDGVALSALQGLIAELRDRRERSAVQAARLQALETELQDLRERLAAH